MARSTDEALAHGIRLLAEAGIGPVGSFSEARADVRITQARECFAEARRGGSPEASARLATLLREGLGGPRDPRRARRLYRESLDAAGDGGLEPATLAALGMMLAEGEGGPRDVGSARRHLSVAARYGSVTGLCGLMDLPPDDPAYPPYPVASPAIRRGRGRSVNEDAFRSVPELGLFVVADAFGGPAAAALALAVFVDAVAEDGASLVDAALRADAAIRNEPSLRGAGVELAALHVADDAAHALRVGNARVWRAPSLSPLADGPWEGAGAVLGADPTLPLRTESSAVSPGDVFVLGTDGLYRLRDLAPLGASEALTLAQLASDLLDGADPDDDATVLCVRALPQRP